MISSKLWLQRGGVLQIQIVLSLNDNFIIIITKKVHYLLDNIILFNYDNFIIVLKK